jgi:hypothetical protein
VASGLAIMEGKIREGERGEVLLDVASSGAKVVVGLPCELARYTLPGVT